MMGNFWLTVDDKLRQQFTCRPHPAVGRLRGAILNRTDGRAALRIAIEQAAPAAKGVQLVPPIGHPDALC
jgi:hypothetical protein